jgi:hypothetical protein
MLKIRCDEGMLGFCGHFVDLINNKRLAIDNPNDANKSHSALQVSNNADDKP